MGNSSAQNLYSIARLAFLEHQTLTRRSPPHEMLKREEAVAVFAAPLPPSSPKLAVASEAITTDDCTLQLLPNQYPLHPLLPRTSSSDLPKPVFPPRGAGIYAAHATPAGEGNNYARHVVLAMVRR